MLSETAVPDAEMKECEFGRLLGRCGFWDEVGLMVGIVEAVEEAEDRDIGSE